mmetsp:Transcript_11492/g.24495  ORF Transcript_11492/g.24495 Transcript_11492/m.24495 type:complete len:219 (-) Transcript_11492:265-921(-)
MPGTCPPCSPMDAASGPVGMKNGSLHRDSSGPLHWPPLPGLFGSSSTEPSKSSSSPELYSSSLAAPLPSPPTPPPGPPPVPRYGGFCKNNSCARSCASATTPRCDDDDFHSFRSRAAFVLITKLCLALPCGQSEYFVMTPIFNAFFVQANARRPEYVGLGSEGGEDCSSSGSEEMEEEEPPTPPAPEGRPMREPPFTPPIELFPGAFALSFSSPGWGR